MTPNTETGIVSPFQQLHRPDEAASAPGSGKGQELSFWDALDVVNPLQHLPVVSTIYRELSGDEISAPARVAGGTLFGGPVGFVSGIVDAVIDEASGDDIGGHVLAQVFGGDEKTADTGTAGTTVASVEPRWDERKAAGQPAATGSATGAAAPTAEGVAASLKDEAPEDPPTPSLSTESGNHVLTGQQALSAFVRDVRAGGGGIPKAEAAPREIEASDRMANWPSARRQAAALNAEAAARPRAGNDRTPYGPSVVASQAALLAAQETASAAQADPGRDSANNPAPEVIERMREALDKYQALHQSE